MEADVAKGTVFNHFPEKEAIIYEHVQSIIREQTPAMLEYLNTLSDTRTRLIAALQKTMEWMHIDLSNDDRFIEGEEVWLRKGFSLTGQRFLQLEWMPLGEKAGT